MSGEYEQEKSSNKTVLIIVVVVAAVLLVALLACGGLGFLALRSVQQVVQSATQVVNDMKVGQAVADQFLTEIASGQLEDAYSSTSAGYQKEHSLEQFKEFIDKNPFLKSQTSQMATTTNVTQNPTTLQLTLQYSLSGPDKSGTCTLTIVKEGDQWKIDHFTVP
jgi:hypothetical protein